MFKKKSRYTLFLHIAAVANPATLLMDGENHGCAGFCCASMVNPTQTAGATSLPSSLTHAHMEPAHAVIAMSRPWYFHFIGTVFMPPGKECFCFCTPTQTIPCPGASGGAKDAVGSDHGNNTLMWPVTCGVEPLPLEPWYVNNEIHHATSTWPAHVMQSLVRSKQTLRGNNYQKKKKFEFAAITILWALTRSRCNKLLQKFVNRLNPHTRLWRAVHPRFSKRNEARVEVGPVGNRAQESHFRNAAKGVALVT